MSFQWTVTPTTAFTDLSRAQANAIRRAVRLLARRYAVEIENHMKANAVWTDRTSHARQSLYTEVREWGQDMVEILLSHGENIPYSVYLELSNQGRFSIISPTLDVYGPRVFADVQALLR